MKKYYDEKGRKVLDKPLKNYFIRAEVEEEYPDYIFVIRAKTQKQAEKLAQKELTTSYPGIFVGKYTDRFSCYEITANELLQRLTIN